MLGLKEGRSRADLGGQGSGICPEPGLLGEKEQVSPALPASSPGSRLCQLLLCPAHSSGHQPSWNGDAGKSDSLGTVHS